MSKYINEIIKNNIIVDDQELILDYINKYGYYRIIECYGNLTKKLKNSNEISTNEIIDIFNIDNCVSNTLNNYILDFEKQLNTKVIDIIYNLNALDDDYVLEIVKNPANSNLKHKGFATFIKDVYDNAKQCNLTNMHNLEQVENIPLKILCVSWNMITLINFISLQDEQIKLAISRHFGFYNDYDGFISICHTIRKFRNSVNHNSIIMDVEIDHYQQSYNYWLNYLYHKSYNLDENINIQKLIEMLNFFLNVDISNIINQKLKTIYLYSNLKIKI